MKRVLAAGAVGVVLSVVGACGGGGDSKDEAKADSTTAAAPTTTVAFNAETAKAEITTTYTTVFNDQTPIDTSVSLIENGEELRSALQAQRASGAANGLSIQIKTIQFQSEVLADVNFDLLLKGAVVAPNTKGQAKYIDGKWKVNEQLFCTLLGLAGQSPDACKKFG